MFSWKFVRQQFFFYYSPLNNEFATFAQVSNTNDVWKVSIILKALWIKNKWELSPQLKKKNITNVNRHETCGAPNWRWKYKLIFSSQKTIKLSTFIAVWKFTKNNFLDSSSKTRPHDVSVFLNRVRCQSDKYENKIYIRAHCKKWGKQYQHDSTAQEQISNWVSVKCCIRKSTLKMTEIINATHSEFCNTVAFIYLQFQVRYWSWERKKIEISKKVYRL